MTRSLSESLEGGSPDQWALDFLRAAGFAPTPANVQAVVSWEYAESAGGGGKWNPLNTTQGGYDGETNLNSVGVKNYARRSDGIAANARVIHNGYYDRVVTAFRQANNPRLICDLITMSVWGTGPIALRGTVHPTPTPQPHAEVTEVTVIALPGKGSPEGRDRIAVWEPTHPNRIVLENGARLDGDTPGGLAGVHVWTPRNSAGSSVIPPGVHGVGISPRFAGGAVVGVVLACTGGLTYRATLA